MELDKLKAAWQSNTSNAQQQLQASIMIQEMTEKKYRSTINKIAYPEMIGTVICLLAIIYIVANFYQLNSFTLQAIGVIAILVLITISILSIVSLQYLKAEKNMSQPFAATLKNFAGKQLKFYKLQKINVALSFLLLVTLIILVTKFFKGKDLSTNKYFWIYSFAAGYLFLLFFSRFVMKYYKKSISKAKEILTELEPG